ncbi:MAG: hypothetical protein IT260_21295 [Saprospiraceae bacterium]|nr:hypothetical protein [Saprospiraceae bacterium]
MSHIWKKILPFLLFLAGIQALSLAQQPDPVFDRFEQLFQRMDEQMRRGMPFDTSFRNGHLRMSPDSNSFFYYHIDTSFNGLGGPEFFQFSPFDDSPMSGFPDFDRLLQQFFNGSDPFFSEPQPGTLPPDDGQEGAGEDQLLPEERLRLQEQQGTAPPNPAAPPQPTKPKVKTIRI